MINVTNIKPRVKGHQTFILRDGWLNKGLVEISKAGNERIFNAPDATDVFGIGTNMVGALKYWLQAFGTIQDRKGGGCQLTDLGNLIFQNDSYLEDIFTIWVLHSNIVKNYEKASLFHDYFNDEKIQIIEKEQLLTIFMRKWNDFSIPENSIKSDIDVLFNTYCKEKINDDPEDKIVSPLVELSLIKKNGEEYIKVQPDLRLIPDEVILYELSNMFEQKYEGAPHLGKSMSIENAAGGTYSLGCIYNLSKVATNQMLNRLENLKYIRVDRTAGLDMIYDEGIPKPLEIIREYYAQR